MVLAAATLTWSLAVLYFALVGAWGLMTIGEWWRRRREPPDVVGDLPDLDAYELARLDRGRYGQIEAVMAGLLESGVLERGAKWGEPESRLWPQNKTYLLGVRSPTPPGAHELERAFARAISEHPDMNPMHMASDVTWDETCDQIETRLTAAGLLYDESRRWRIAWFGWALFWIADRAVRAREQLLVGHGAALGARSVVVAEPSVR